ncbi:iron ABC transporter permease [Methanocella sp. CWC-04]|uniref:Cobalamin import system permease protein BtuC n=1 Tax=Methanooceanicella nereidis TaxID=2052831 RepID=A0AAP2W6U1_9EURY|nr:iron ABC transporter permease [Methanocella sp. CWC-04]MCD1295708.1 iron ABC transporter permease [Methanocella sp. CWC-04]
MNLPGKKNLQVQHVVDLYKESHLKRVVLLIVILAVLVFTSLYAISAGTANISIEDVFLSIAHSIFPDLFAGPDNEFASIIVLNMRLPRILLAIFTGVSLAVAGAVMQGTLRNPLVSPFTLGLASAASFGAAMTIVMGTGILGLFMAGMGNYDIIFNAFLFGCFSMLIIYAIARVKGTSQATLILAGVVIGYIFQAGVLILKYSSNNEKLKELVVWLMGGMWGANWNAVIIVSIITTICVILLWLMAWRLNALSAGDEIAKNLGINVEGTRLFCLMIATMAASSCLAFTGVIGFIGLMAPHICRMLIGNDHRFLVPCAALMGGLILLISDTFARTIMSPIEIPVGIIMYILGGVFFLYLLLRGRESHIY